ncbi:MAG: CotH kinase family protein [Bacteroidales bacterium]|nr:CotH kinase family protein [Bacteroidales bacterium]
MNARRFGFLFALILVTVSCRKDDVPSGPDALPDTGLPVVCIDTEGGRAVESKAINYPASVKIIGAGVYDGLETAGCTVRGRGNTSWSWPKKPYRLDFPDRVPLLGMPAGRHWVLLANFPDRTLMRNLVAMKVASLTSLAWTPRCVPVELVMNGRHAGSYLLIEKVEVDAERVDVSQDGGYLLESDFRFDNEVQWIDHHGISRLVTGIPFAIKYPSPDDLTRAQEEFVRQYVADAASALWSDGFEDPETGYAAWIDVDSFIDYWLVFEIMGNPELSNPCSVFYHLDAGGKLAAGPCWDFDICLRSLGTSVQEWTGFVNRYAVWYARLFKDPAFADRVRERFLELLPQLLEVEDYIDGCHRLLAASAELNFAQWNPASDLWMNFGLPINGDESLLFDEAVTRLREVYLRRLEMLKNNL